MKKHILILLAGLCIALAVMGGIWFLPCEDGFMIGMCVLTKAYFAAIISIIFLLWLIISTLIYIHSKLKHNQVTIKKYLVILASIIIILVSWLIFASLIGTRISDFIADIRMQNTICKNREGLNILSETWESNNYKTEAFCRNGRIHGTYKKFENGQLMYDAVYSEGKLHGQEKSYNLEDGSSIETSYIEGKKIGPEVYFNRDGATTNFVINDGNSDNGKTIYFNAVEKSFDIESVRPEAQEYLCNIPETERSEFIYYSCTGNRLNGKYQEINSATREVYEEFTLENGILNGPAIVYKDGRIQKYANYTNGKLNGKIYEESEYEGQYLNGVQIGVFKMSAGINSVVRFQNGRIVEIIEPKNLIL